MFCVARSDQIRSDQIRSDEIGLIGDEIVAIDVEDCGFDVLV